MTSTDHTTIRHELVVAATIERAFWTYVNRFDLIKPREHNLLSAPIEATVFETFVGGTVFDRGADGSVCQWARVLAFEPPHRLLISWDINPHWGIETDPARCSEVEVSFTEEPGDRTRVVLTHRHLDRHGVGWQAARDGVDGDQGWPLYLQRYGDLVTTADTSDGPEADMHG